ncbi:MAG: hypothetical protein VXV96_02800 [Bdellovibrionota bacterium]|jgi:tetratricopeptide (TPR) repeat protein|nr:hypothetical protein [Bdellovibrionota bacterium]
MFNKVCSLFLTALLLTGSAYGNYTAKQIQEIRTRAPGLTSKGVNRRLLRAQEMVVRDDRKGAIQILEGMTAKSYRPFEMGKIWQSLAYAYAQTDQFDKARNAFKKSIETNALPYKAHLQSLFGLAQLRLMAEKYKLAEDSLGKWFQLTKEERADAYVFKATIAYQKGDKKSALTAILKALQIEKKPKEQWLTFAVSLLYENNRYKEASELLYKLVEMNHGKKMYWTQLAGTLLNSDKDMEALAVMDLALMMELLDKEGEIRNIVSLYLSNGLPYEGSQLLEKGIKKGFVKETKKNLELFGNSLIQAKEYDKAFAPLKKAAKLSDDGKMYALIARLYLEKENFKTAVQNFDLALSKGIKKENRGQVYVEKAIALTSLKRVKEAIESLDQAEKYKESKELAAKWRGYVNNL